MYVVRTLTHMANPSMRTFQNFPEVSIIVTHDKQGYTLFAKKNVVKGCMIESATRATFNHLILASIVEFYDRYAQGVFSKNFIVIKNYWTNTCLSLVTFTVNFFSFQCRIPKVTRRFTTPSPRSATTCSPSSSTRTPTS